VIAGGAAAVALFCSLWAVALALLFIARLKIPTDHPSASTRSKPYLARLRPTAPVCYYSWVLIFLKSPAAASAKALALAAEAPIFPKSDPIARIHSVFGIDQMLQGLHVDFPSDLLDRFGDTQQRRTPLHCDRANSLLYVRNRRHEMRRPCALNMF
jgi:hypothetical protein